jgi:hypothetical protein
MFAESPKRWRWVALAGLVLVGSAIAIRSIHTWSKAGAVVPATQAATVARAPGQIAPMDVEYSVKTKDDTPFADGDLLAEVNGKRQVVMSASGLRIEEVGDFDGNGVTDALISSCGGGNSSPTTYSIVSTRGNGEIAVSDLASSWQGKATTENWHGRWSVVIVSDGQGELGGDVRRRFVFDKGQAIVVEDQRHLPLKALVELRTDMFNGDEDDTHKLEFDLDGDGKADVINGRWWSRWSLILWSASFADGKSFEGHTGCHRVGVLETKTHGVHDLVCNADLVFQWDGDAYMERPGQ